MMESLTVTVTTPHSPSRPSLSNAATLPAREDCWPEDATFTLIDAWGKCFLELNRGNLRQKHWEEVADAVNRLHGHVRRRTDIQCKNRIDTLKKKYKIEKARALEHSDDDDDGGGGGCYKSDWPFFKSLDRLIGSTFPPKKPSPPITVTTPPAWPFNSPVPVGPRSSKRLVQQRSLPAIATPPFPTPVPVGLRSSKRPAKPWAQSTLLAADDSHFRRRFSALAAAAAAEEEEEEDEDEDENEDEEESGTKRQKRERREEEVGFREVAMAIERLGEIYERVESKKQQFMLELEKQRMQFLKDLEFQRMQLFVETQLQLQKIKPTVKTRKPISTSNCACT